MNYTLHSQIRNEICYSLITAIMNRRSERVQSLIQEELGKIILRELEFPSALVTITSVDVDKKLERAKVKLSVLPPSEEKKILTVVGKAAGELQHLLMKKINIKPMPRIAFEIDHGLENAANIEKLLIDE